MFAASPGNSKVHEGYRYGLQVKREDDFWLTNSRCILRFVRFEANFIVDRNQDS
jgi:hypothetical protein